MAKQKRSQHRIDPDDVLEGRARPSARELLALIHEVNPSGHDLPQKESARRYVLKSRLQSLLVRRFADEVVVEPGDEAGVVGLRHRTSGDDACHAVIAALDDDARSWVQMRLDVGDDEESVPSVTPREEEEPASSLPPSGAPLDDLSTDDLLRWGRAAVDAYDYLAARERFAAALGRGRREAARLLLTVLVENLGLDDEALALEERLDDRTLGEGEVRLLLAQAAARAGERPRALRLVKSDMGDAAADIFATLARAALGRGDVDDAAADLAQIRLRSPSHPALLELSETLRKRRAEERAPLEAEAQRLFDEGRFDEAEARAQALSARWPESAVARAITRAGEERRRFEQARALAAEGREALEKGESGRALGLIRKAMTLGLRPGDAGQAERDLYRAEAAERSRMERERAGEVIHLLQEGHMLRALVEYAALDDPRRDMVKGASMIDELFYFDQTLVRGAGAEVKATAQAVMALKRALPLVEMPESVLGILAPHMALLQAVPHAVQAFEQSTKLVTLKNETAANERLTEAMGAVHGGSREALEKSLKILAGIRREHLDPEGQTLFDRMTVQFRRILDRLDRALEIRKMRNAGNLVAAREALTAIIAIEEAESDAYTLEDDPHEERREERTAGWRRQREDVIRMLARALDLVSAGPPAADGLLGMVPASLRDVPQSILPGGREVVLVEAHERWVFFHMIDPASGRAARRGSYRMREPLALGRVQQHDGRLVMITTEGAPVAMDVVAWDMKYAHGLSFGGGEKPDDSVIAVGGRFAWMTRLYSGWWTSIAVDDLEKSGHGRAFSEAVAHLAIHPLLGLKEPRVLVLRENHEMSQHEVRGAPIPGTQRTLPALLRSVVVHPCGDRLFALLYEEDPMDDVDPAGPPPRWLPTFRVRWAELTLEGALVAAPAGEDRVLAGFDPEGPYEVATALDARMVFVLYTTTAGARRLAGVGATEGAARVARRFDVEVPARVTLAQDERARDVAALSPHEGGVEVVRLSSAPPVFVATRLSPELAAPLRDLVLAPVRPCAPYRRRLWVLKFAEAMPALGLEYLRQLSREIGDTMVEQTLRDREGVVARYTALAGISDQPWTDRFAAAAEARYGGDPELAQMPATRAALAGRWAEVRDRLAPVDPAPLRDDAARHHDHLLGVAHLMLGDAAEARRVLSRGAARPGFCDLALPLALSGVDVPGPACAAVRALERALRAADARLAAGDAAGARRALSGLVVRETREVQTLARLCRAWLSTPDGEKADAFAKRMALAVFFAAHAERSPLRRRELPYAAGRWDTATLDALAVEAMAWLDEEVRVRQERTKI